MSHTSSFVFPGFPSYLEAAGNQLGRPELVPAAGRQIALTALANLCAQVSQVDPVNVEAVLDKAREFRDQLAIALQAADAMLADVEWLREAPDQPQQDTTGSPSEASPSVVLSATQPAQRRRERLHDRVRNR